MGLAAVAPWVEGVLALLVLGHLARAYRGLWASFYYFATSYFALAAVVVLVLAVVYGLIGTGFGLVYLFWSDNLVVRGWASLAVTDLFLVIATIAFYVDPSPERSLAELQSFLGAGGSGVRRLAHRLALGTRGPESIDHDGPHRLRAFLGVACAPLVVLLALPAALPHAFPNVPPAPAIASGPVEGPPLAAPRVRSATAPGPAADASPSPIDNEDAAESDQGTDLADGALALLDWALALAAWLGGIVLGFFAAALVLLVGHASYPTLVEIISHTEQDLRGAGRAGEQEPARRAAAFVYEQAFPERARALKEGADDPQGPRPASADAADAPPDRPRRGLAGFVLVAFLWPVFTLIGWLARNFRAAFLLLLIASTGLAGVLAQGVSLPPWSYLPVFEALAFVAFVKLANLPAARFDRLAEPARLARPAEVRLRRRVAIATFFLMIFGIYLGLCAVWWLHLLTHRLLGWHSEALLRVAMPPAMLLCLALALGCLVYAAFVYYKAHVKVPLLFLLIAMLLIANNDAFKHRLPHMDHAYAGPAAYPEVVARYANTESRPGSIFDQGGGAALRDAPLSDQGALDGWRGRLQRPGRPQPKLAIVAASGGGNRSAFWTATVLEALEADLGPAAGSAGAFHDHVRLMTGASGGMVASAHYVAAAAGLLGRGHAHHGAGAKAPDPGHFFDAIEPEGLASVVQQVVLGDLPWALVPLPQLHDRGDELDHTWHDLDAIPLRALRDQERRGEVPSLVFSPMLVEDGRRLLISNLGLSELCATAGGLIVDEATREESGHAYSVSAVPFRDLFGGERGADFRLATAVRLSATFPYVSPAASLPTAPPRRVVDAGYYDNYGIDVAIAWAYQHRRWLDEHTSGVLLVQVRAYTGQRDRLDVLDRDGPASLAATLARGAQFLTSPIDAMGEARYTSNSFRNDGEVKGLADWFNIRPEGDRKFFTTVIFENPTEASLSWYTTRAERAQLRQGMGLPAGPGPARRNPVPRRDGARHEVVRRNIDKLKKLRDWWSSDQSAASRDEPRGWIITGG